MAGRSPLRRRRSALNCSAIEEEEEEKEEEEKKKILKFSLCVLPPQKERTNRSDIFQNIAF